MGTPPYRMGPPPSPNRDPFPFAGTLDYQGIPILVENPLGSTRRGVDAGGHPWETHMQAHYGEVEGTRGLDGDPVDVFVGPDPEASTAYVVHQKVPGTQRPDEDKVILGCGTAEEAKALYLAHYNRPGFFHGITSWTVEELQRYLAREGNHRLRLDSPARVRALLKAEEGSTEHGTQSVTVVAEHVARNPGGSGTHMVRRHSQHRKEAVSEEGRRARGAASRREQTNRFLAKLQERESEIPEVAALVHSAEPTEAQLQSAGQAVEAHRTHERIVRAQARRAAWFAEGNPKEQALKFAVRVREAGGTSHIHYAQSGSCYVYVNVGRRAESLKFRFSDHSTPWEGRDTDYADPSSGKTWRDIADKWLSSLTALQKGSMGGFRLLVRLSALRKAGGGAPGQLGLFGAPRPTTIQVKEHFAHNPGGVGMHVVHEHQRGIEGAEEKPTEPHPLPEGILPAKTGEERMAAMQAARDALARTNVTTEELRRVHARLPNDSPKGLEMRAAVKRKIDGLAETAPSPKVPEMTEPIPASPEPVAPEVTLPAVASPQTPHPSPKPPKISAKDSIPTVPRGEHQEVGSHVTGSRKDLALRSFDEIASLPIEDAARLVTKEKLLTKVTEEEWRTRGGTPGGFIVRKAVERAIAPKPADASPASRMAYVRALDFVAKSLDGCKTAKDIDNFLIEFDRLSQDGKVVGTFRTEEEASAAITREEQRVDGDMGWGRTEIVGPNQWLGYILNFRNSKTDNPYYGHLKALGKPFTGMVKGAYVPRMAAFAGQMIWSGRSDSKAYANALKDALGADLREKSGETVPAQGEPKRASKERLVWARRMPETPERVGGRPVEKADAAAMLQEFGLHNVQFGDWTNQEDRDHHLSWCHGALRDLSDVLGVDPGIVTMQPLTAKSNRAPLSIGIGARGSGNAKAHYEPLSRDAGGKLAPVINLTKFAGGGSLAHEWGHFLDNILSEAHGGAVDRRGNRTGIPGHVSAGDATHKLPTPVKAALGEVQKAIRGSGRPSQYLSHADAMGSYWKSPHEMFARAFESYVQDKLKEGGRKNSYLVAGTEKEYPTGKMIEGTEESALSVPEVRAAKELRDARRAEVNRVREPYAKAHLAGKKSNERNILAAYTHADSQPEVRAAWDAFREANRPYREMLKQHRKEEHAQPYPQGEERKAINAAFDTFFDALRREKTLEKALVRLTGGPRYLVQFGALR